MRYLQSLPRVRTNHYSITIEAKFTALKGEWRNVSYTIMETCLPHTPQQPGRIRRPSNPDISVRPKSAAPALTSIANSPYRGRIAIPLLRLRRKLPLTRVPGQPSSPKKKPDDTVHSSTKDSETSINNLQAQVKTLEEQLRNITQERDRLSAQLMKPRGSKSPSLVKVYRTLWKRLLESQWDQKTLKMQLLSRLKDKTRLQVETVLKELKLKSRNIAALLGICYSDDRFDVDKLSADLKKYQPMTLHEDVVSHISHLCFQLALRNLSRADFIATFHSSLPAYCQQNEATSFLTNPDIGLSVLVAKPIVNFWWKGETSAHVNQLDMDVLPEWELLEEVIKRARLHLAISDIHLSEVCKFIHIPLTPARLKEAAGTHFGLNEHQSSLLTAHFFPNPSAHAITTLSTTLAPAWMTRSELDLDERLAELAMYMDEMALCQIGEITTPVSMDYLSLSHFEKLCEEMFKRQFTKEQKAALELFCFEKTGMLDALCFKDFQSAVRCNALRVVNIDPEQPLDSELI